MDNWIMYYECPICGEITKTLKSECDFCHTPLSVDMLRQESKWIIDRHRISCPNCDKDIIKGKKLYDV